MEVASISCMGSMEVGVGQNLALVHTNARDEIQVWALRHCGRPTLKLYVWMGRVFRKCPQVFRSLGNDPALTL